MTLSGFCCCCVKQLHTRYHPGVDQHYQTFSFEGTRCKKAQFWFRGAQSQLGYFSCIVILPVRVSWVPEVSILGLGRC